ATTPFVKLLDFLQGKWLGHPLHPAIVHVPIGLWTVAAAADLAVWGGLWPETLPHLAFYAVGLGVAAALLAIPTGAADWAAIKPEKPAWRLTLYHLVLNLTATVLWTVNFGLRLGTEPAGAVVHGWIVATSLAGAALVWVGGYLGSLLVFDHGIGVARQSKKKWREIAARGGARLPEEKS
ncbi:MAG TPA: DUF2231 domain-containing protein, partial [Candidatus Synoicihabitans sp.]|nr:DUF2231 domain-containing protein [Candidatus Synoicihabitans sp.]